MAPPRASGTKDGQDRSLNREGASIRNKDASRVNKLSAQETRVSGQMVSGPTNSKSNTTAAPRAKSSRLSKGPASDVSQDESVEGESSTRASIPRAATRQPIPPPVHSNEGDHVESPHLPRFTEDSSGAQHFRIQDWDLNGPHDLIPTEQREQQNHGGDRARTLREEESSSRQTATHHHPAPVEGTRSIIQDRRQEKAHVSTQPRPNITGPQPLSPAILASLAAEKAKYKEEELDAKLQYIKKHSGGGWGIEDFQEVGLRGGRSEKGAVTPTSSPVVSSPSITDSESTISGDSPVEATEPSMAPASRSVEAAHSSAPSSLVSPSPSKHVDAPVDSGDSAMTAAAESVTPPSPHLLPIAGSLGNGRGKAVAVDQDEKSAEESSEEPAEDPTSDDDITDQYRNPTHANGQSSMASSSHGPIEKEVKKMPPGHVAIDEGTHSRAQILAGAPQPEALTIMLRTEKRDEHNVATARALVTHKYTKEINWADAREVKCLNKWRNQILIRAFKSKHERRWKYTLSEMNTLCQFLDIQLAIPTVDGLMANVDWAWVTTNYNSFFQGQIQRAGELYASASYTGDDGRKTSAAGQPMKYDRDAPFRSEIALKNQIYHFRDKRAVDLVRNSRGARSWDEPQEPASDEPQEDTENIPSVLSSERSSPSSKGSLKKLIFTLGNGSKVTLENKKRANTEDPTDEEICPPNKKTKFSGPSHLRGGSGGMWEGPESDFDYSEDAAPPTHYQGHELRSDSPFRQSSPSRTARGFSNAESVLGQGRTEHGVNNRSMVARSTSLSGSEQSSREIEENYDDDSDYEGTSSSHKANMEPRLPQEAQFPPAYSQARHPLPAVRNTIVDAQDTCRCPSPRRPRNIDAPQRHLLPNGPLLPAQYGSPQRAPPSNSKKRARNHGDANMGNNSQQVPSKRPRLQDQDQDGYRDQHPVRFDPVQLDTVAGGPNQIFLSPFPHNSSVANREAALGLRLRAPVRGPQVVTRTLGQAGLRLPTLDDYFFEE
ncbi:uncharacterized protein EAE97_011849 [Botrytis byssoidea]|uniref:Uncharacterized protein n=1 Tax=Botrytis byssoidea TaxID=139641 RepID=A0A9P5HSH1_9HELO|nr:uncharacterized protein EAE97_011849 [Botrytis byssoidea]KAF7918754.1 hypothetical protein EAE97_011849 [Botrytis byssoidea]